MRKAKIVIGIALAVILVAGAAVWLLFDANRFRGQIQAKLEQQLQRKVELGDIRLGLLPIRLTVKKLAIAEDTRFASKAPFTQAELLDVRVSLAALLRGAVQIDSIDLNQPQVELIRNKDGVWNFASLGGTPPTTPPAPGAEPPPPAPAPDFSLRRLAIRNGSIAITDLQKKTPRAVYDGIDISLLDFKPGQPFSFDIAAHMPGASSQSIQIKGTGGPLPESGPATMPLKATLSLNAIDIAGLRKFFASDSMPNAAGILSGETQIESQAGKLSGAGKLSLSGAKVGTVDVGYPIELDYAVASDTNTGLVKIPSATLKLGKTALALTGSVNTNPNPVEVDLRLKTGETSIAEIARLASAFGVAFSPDTAVAGKVSGDIQARGATDRLALSGTIQGRDLQISGNSVPQPVHIRALDLALTPAEIRSNEFEAKSGQTSVLGKFALRQYTSNSPTAEISLKAPGAALPEIQAIAKAYGVSGLDQLSGAGNLNFDLHAAGPVEALTANAARALNGTLNLDFNTMRIQGFDAARELGRIGGFMKSDPDRTYTDVLKLAGRVVVKNGVAETNDLTVQLPEGNLAVIGTSDLAEQTLNLRATAIFSKALSDKVGGSTKIGGYLTTALSNDSGEIVIPAIISGTMEKPKFAPDGQAFLQMQTKKLLPGLSNPKAVLSGMLDSLTGKKKPEEPAAPPAEAGAAPAAPAAEQPKPKIQDVLKGILGGKK